MGLVCTERRCGILGLPVIEQVISALREAGFPTQRAYPGTAMPAITQVVAAVRLAEADLEKRETTLEVMLLCPQNLGAPAVEDAAVTAGEALKDIDLYCVIGSAEFDGKSGLFSIRCLATKPEKKRTYLDVPFRIGAVDQSRVVSFTSQRQTSETVTQLSEAPWTVRLEQFFRNGYGEDSDPSSETFTITNGEEVYLGCKWTSCKRTRELEGTRQIREGTAVSRTIQ